MGALMAQNPSIAAVTAFYLIFAFGLVWFAVFPALAFGSWTAAFVNAAVLGLVGNATYDLTNLAVTRGFPMTLAIVDLAWGDGAVGRCRYSGLFRCPCRSS